MMNNSTVSDVMTTQVVTARPAMPLKEFARLLAEHRISALPVLDADDRLVGIASERDLLSKQAEPLLRPRHWWQPRRTREETRRAEADTVGHLMTGRPITIAPTATLAEAARRMTQHEDNSMLLRWDIERPGQFLVMPAPLPTWEGVTYAPSVGIQTFRTGSAGPR
jgi:CBS domain-containing protein